MAKQRTFDNRGKHPLYHLYMQMIRRCTDTHYKGYKHHGGRGIQVCQAWLDDFWQFIQDIGERPGPEYSLDRYPNNDGNYEPGNIRWATQVEQNRHARGNHLITYQNITQCCSAWSETTGIPATVIRWRSRQGWAPEAIFQPLLRNRQVNNQAFIMRQLFQQGYTNEEILQYLIHSFGMQAHTLKDIQWERNNNPMANVKGAHVDTTYLTIDQTITRRYAHRDYIAHCIKYSHLIKFIREQCYWVEPWLLDVGCGKETPLAKPLAARQNVRAEHVGYYLGIDYGPIDRRWLSEHSTFPAEFLPMTDFATVEWPEEFIGAFHILNCQEVLEHVEPEHAFRMLQKMHLYMADTGRAFISTPIYNGKAAANHVNEMTFFGFETLMELAGFEVEHVQGTFASQKDYKDHMNEHCQWMYERLRNWFEPEILAITMGPLIDPHLARNALWRMVKSKPITLDDATWEYLAQPQHGSSTEWTSFIQSLMPRRMPLRQLRGG